jgi:hypothetical protein
MMQLLDDGQRRIRLDSTGGEGNLYGYVAADPINGTDPTGTLYGTTQLREIQRQQELSTWQVNEAGKLVVQSQAYLRGLLLTSGAIATALGLSLSGDHEEQDGDAWVVRGGIMDASVKYPDGQQVFRIDPRHGNVPEGFSVQYKPGSSLRQLTSGYIENNRISITSRSVVQLLGTFFPEIGVVETPTDSNPYHGTFTTSSPASYSLAKRVLIAAFFIRVPNIYR